MSDIKDIKYIRSFQSIKKIFNTIFTMDLIVIYKNSIGEPLELYLDVLLDGNTLNAFYKRVLEVWISDPKKLKFFSGLMDQEYWFVAPLRLEDGLQGLVVACDSFSHSKEKSMKNGINFLDPRFASEKNTSVFFEIFERLVKMAAEEIHLYYEEIKYKKERLENTLMRSDAAQGDMVGHSEAMLKIYNMIRKIAKTDSSVLITGENGTGKELIARSIWESSLRYQKIFLSINCSAFNESLLESELFGHVRGSFTGAIKDKKGLLEIAHEGTLFLDELGDMPLGMQVKLLRFLQEGQVLPIGSTSVRHVDVRVIAATNKNLLQLMKEKTFREDLYYRLNVLHIHIPPLRERKSDIPLLVEYFLSKECKKNKIPLKSCSRNALQKLYDYNWPGNIRELENEVTRVVLLSDDDLIIEAASLSSSIQASAKDIARETTTLLVKQNTFDLENILQKIEEKTIFEALTYCSWNNTKASQVLGISRTQLIKKIRQYGLKKT